MFARALEQQEKDFFQEYMEVVPEEGALRWKKARNKFTTHLVGKLVASNTTNSKGYKMFSIKRPDTNKTQNYFTHRIIYFLTYGEEPRVVDHINGDVADNRPCNLRDCDAYQNAVNVNNPHKGSVGFRGVSISDSGSFVANIKENGKLTYLGVYSTAEDAHEAYKKKHIELHGEYSPYYNQEIREVERINERNPYLTKEIREKKAVERKQKIIAIRERRISEKKQRIVSRFKFTPEHLNQIEANVTDVVDSMYYEE